MKDNPYNLGCYAFYKSAKTSSLKSNNSNVNEVKERWIFIMKKIKSIFLILPVILISAFINVSAANLHSFSTTANSNLWNAFATNAKNSNNPYFGAIPDLMGNQAAPDILMFAVTSPSDYNYDFCRLTVTEGNPAGNWCQYLSHIKSDKGMRVTAHVKSVTYAPFNFQVAGVINYY